MRRGLALLCLAACGSSPPVVTVSPEPGPAERAKERYPSLFALQVGLVEKTCSPNPGVCHNSNNYPELSSLGNLVATVGAPCNLEIPDPSQGWDGCEPRADVLILGAERNEIAWVERVGPGGWRFGLRSPAARTERVPFVVQSAENEVVLNAPREWNVQISLVAGAAAAEVGVAPPQPFLLDFVDSVLATVVGGDGNRNGVFGAETSDRAALVRPGSLETSYLWGRLTGERPGSRMPLANEPLDEAAYVALACWIEGGAGAQIDYEGCAFARSPRRYADP